MTASQPLGSANMYAYHVCLPLWGGGQGGGCTIQSRLAALSAYLENRHIHSKNLT